MRESRGQRVSSGHDTSVILVASHWEQTQETCKIFARAAQKSESRETTTHKYLSAKRREELSLDTDRNTSCEPPPLQAYLFRE